MAAGTPPSTQAIGRAVAAFYGDMPHPKAPTVTVNEYPAYERVAFMMNDTKPDGAAVTHAAESLKQAGISPSEFEQVWHVARPVANRLLGRDPNLIEVQRLKTADPKAIQQHYLDHPFPGYEEVTAGQMARHYRAAEPIARQYGRVPNHEEVSRFALVEADHDYMHQHFSGEKL